MLTKESISQGWKGKNRKISTLLKKTKILRHLKIRTLLTIKCIQNNFYQCENLK